MNKKEFLDLLRQALEGEVDNSILEQSISFYSQYISSHSDKSEEEVIQEIGDPRLIAKTIIETEKASGRESSSGYDNRSHDDSVRSTAYQGDSDNSEMFHRIKWYHKAIIVLILLFLFLVLIRLGWILIRLFFMFLVPIIIIALLFTIFRRR